MSLETAINSSVLKVNRHIMENVLMVMMMVMAGMEWMLDGSECSGAPIYSTLEETCSHNLQTSLIQ